jgi:hypothetical protein
MAAPVPEIRLSIVRHIEMHTAEPLVPDLSAFGFEICIVKFEKVKLPGSDQILAQLIQAGGESSLSDIHKPSNYCTSLQIV